MAVVFISPKDRQKMFLIGIIVIFGLFLAIIFFGIFFSKPKEVSSSLVFNKPKISIDMKIFEKDEFKNLDPFPEIEKVFSYQAQTARRQIRTGYISASSLEDAKASLESTGLAVVGLKEVEIGRDNPFEPYYQVITPPIGGPIIKK